MENENIKSIKTIKSWCIFFGLTFEILRSDQVFLILPATLVVPVVLAVVYLIRRKKINLVLDAREKKGDVVL